MTVSSLLAKESGKEKEKDLDIYGKIEIATEELTPEYLRRLSRTNDNALPIARYIIALGSETNRRNIIKITSSLSLFCKNKDLKFMTREKEVLPYLDSL